MFEALDSEGYANYLTKNPFHQELKLDLVEYLREISEDENVKKESNFRLKRKKGVWDSFRGNNLAPYPANLDDLIRLHFLVTSRRVTTILEFGVGKSTIVFEDALKKNQVRHSNYVNEHLRRSNAFECHSVDNSVEWIEFVSKQANFEHVSFHFSKCSMGTFNGRICTFYDELPNICPDFIYMDGPDQLDVENDVRGISTRSPDRLPMAADVLALEHFLLPGTLIVIDGRAANARFLLSNLQRNWRYEYIEGYDQHFFELNEEPLGPFNALQLDFSKSIAHDRT